MNRTETTRIFGRGTNPINFVSVRVGAGVLELAAVDPALRGEIVEPGGPDNLTLKQVVEIIESETETHGPTRHILIPMMRVMLALMRPINASVARHIRSGVLMDTVDMSFDPGETVRRYPSLSPTSLREVVRRELRDEHEATPVSKVTSPHPNSRLQQ